jgi:curli biogenesis system outer membrane secretion channel CsgG
MARHILIFIVGLLLLPLLACSALPSRSNQAPTAAPSKDIEMRDVEVPARGAEEAPRNRVLVLPFLDEKPERSKKVAEAARTVLVRELLKSRQFIVIGLEDFPQDPKKFINTEQDYDMGAIARLASSMGIAAVIEGKILEVHAKKAGDSVGLFRRTQAEVETKTRIRVYAGKNGKEILNEIRTASEQVSSTHMGEMGGDPSEDPELVKVSVRKAFMSGLPSLVKAVEKLNWEGRIAMVAGEKIYINAGRLSGLQVGDILKITEDGDEVFDPDSGKFIGTAPGRMKGTVEVVSYFGKDGCVTVVHSGSSFAENDRVELY